MAAIFFYYVIQTTPSDAESREEQGGCKHKFVRGMTAKIWPNLRQGVAKTLKRNEMKHLNSPEEDNFPCKL